MTRLSRIPGTLVMDDYDVVEADPVEALRRALAAGDTARIDAILGRLDPTQIAEDLGDLDPDEKATVFERLPPADAADVLAEADDITVEDLAEDASERLLVAAIAEMAPDDATDVVAAMPAERRHAVLTQIPGEQADDVRDLLRYDEETAGGIMTPDIAAVPDHVTAREAIQRTQDEIEGERFYALFVTDADDRLVGVVPVHRLLFAPGNRRIREIMNTDVLSVDVATDQEEAARLARRYDLSSLPVTDQEGRLVGAITFDDAMDVLREENDEDMYRMAGSAERDPTHESSPRRFLLRMPWLLVTLAGGMGLASVTGLFEQALGQRIIFAFFIPVVLGMAGNVGLQSATTIVRGLATGDVKPGRALTILGRELQVGALLALACGMIGGGFAACTSLALGNTPAVGVVVGVAMACAIIVASVSSTVIPLSVHRLGADPAVAAGPFVTLLNDLCGLTIYLLMVRLLSSAIVA